MHPKIGEILEYINNNEYFKTIKDTEKFARVAYETYPNRDLVAEMKKAYLWLTGNPKRLKKNYAKFLVNWFNNAFTKKHFFIGGKQ